MSAEIINLRQARKGKARAEKERQADQNRLTFGRSKAEKNLTRALNEQAEKRLDHGHMAKSGDRPDDE